LALVFVVPALVSDSTRYQAVVAGVQAFGVIIALLFAAVTIRNDTQDKRVDRAVELHDLVVSEPIYDARVRLAQHLRAFGDGAVRLVSQDELRNDPLISRYDPDPGVTPQRDLNRILRIFERSNALRLSGATDFALLHRLLGQHVLWWDRAIGYAEHEHLRQPLRDLAEWVRGYTREHPHLDYVTTWNILASGDFGGPL
jgi:hypothetical protein